MRVTDAVTLALAGHPSQGGRRAVLAGHPSRGGRRAVLSWAGLGETACGGPSAKALEMTH